jgi:hypothetical protein
MFTRLLTAGALAATVLSAVPAVAQSAAEQRRFDDAQARFDREYDLFRQAVDRYRSSRTAGYQGSNYDDRGGYRTAPDAYVSDGPATDDRYEPNYDPSRYYRVGPNYQERVLTTNERVYAGTDGRYYCRRSDGTTGLIVGGATGGILGNVIDGGHSRRARRPRDRAQPAGGSLPIIRLPLLATRLGRIGKAIATPDPP